MKASHFIVPAVFTFAAGFALAADEYKKFDEVDTNKDGLLSVSEARTALPDLQISTSGSGTSGGAASSTASSASGDAMLTRDAVKRALPEISFEGGDERGPITEEEYDMIVQELEERGSAASSSSRSASGAASSSTRPSSQGSQSSQGAQGSQGSGSGAASSSTNRNANSTSQPGASSSSSGSQQSTSPATRPDSN